MAVSSTTHSSVVAKTASSETHGIFSVLLREIYNRRAIDCGFPTMPGLKGEGSTFVIPVLRSQNHKLLGYIPCYNAVSQMRLGHDPTTALHTALAPIIRHYPGFHGAMLAVDKYGNYGAACHGYTSWTFCVVNPRTGGVIQKTVDCI
ncbi:hypothetical protein FSP39_024737 [Pinctada imbricata]|uniref:Uncharacterized protein n=1 Tax=Pinctada imbricata TaxID=66713 RepID=A0AA88Y9N9_PINIB|nr:hypothetical protein FSP39_024737 [Pinctada imbricata]